MIDKQRIAKLTAAMLLDRAKLNRIFSKQSMQVDINELIEVLEWAQELDRIREESLSSMSSRWYYLGVGGIH